MVKIGEDGLYIHLLRKNYINYGLGEKTKKGEEINKALEIQHNLIKENILNQNKINNWEDKKEKINELFQYFSSSDWNKNNEVNQKNIDISNNKEFQEIFLQALTAIVKNNYNNISDVDWTTFSGKVKAIEANQTQKLFQNQSRRKQIINEKGTIEKTRVKKIIKEIKETLQNSKDKNLKDFYNDAVELEKALEENENSIQKRKGAVKYFDTKAITINRRGSKYSLKQLIDRYNRNVEEKQTANNISNSQGWIGETAIAGIGYLALLGSMDSSNKEIRQKYKEYTQMIADMIDNNIINYNKEKKKYQTTGSDLIIRKYTDIQWNEDGFEQFAQLLEKDKKKAKTFIKRKGGQQEASVQYSLTSTGTQGKIDVNFSSFLPSDNILSDLKISIKNYQSTSQLTIASGNPLLFFMNLFDPSFNAHWLNLHTKLEELEEKNFKENKNRIHRLMKVSIASAAISGYIGQGKNNEDKMANLLAINQSTSSKGFQFVTVYDFVDTLLKKYEDETMINTLININFKNKETDNNSNIVIRQDKESSIPERISKILMQLHNIKVHTEFYYSHWKNLNKENLTS